MVRIRSALASSLLTGIFPLFLFGHAALASGGNATVQYVALHRQACPATASAPVTGSIRVSEDDQGGTPPGVEINSAVTAGIPRTTYTVIVLNASCAELAQGGTLKTDDSGRGDLDFHVSGSVIPPGTTVRIQLVASGVNDVLSSDASLPV